MLTTGVTLSERVPDRFDSSHGGSGVFLLSPCVPVQIAFISYFQHFRSTLRICVSVMQ